MSEGKELVISHGNLLEEQKQLQEGIVDYSKIDREDAIPYIVDFNNENNLYFINKIKYVPFINSQIKDEVIEGKKIVGKIEQFNDGVLVNASTKKKIPFFRDITVKTFLFANAWSIVALVVFLTYVFFLFAHLAEPIIDTMNKGQVLTLMFSTLSLFLVFVGTLIYYLYVISEIASKGIVAFDVSDKPKLLFAGIFFIAALSLGYEKFIETSYYFDASVLIYFVVAQFIVLHLFEKKILNRIKYIKNGSLIYYSSKRRKETRGFVLTIFNASDDDRTIQYKND